MYLYCVIKSLLTYRQQLNTMMPEEPLMEARVHIVIPRIHILKLAFRQWS